MREYQYGEKKTHRSVTLLPAFWQLAKTAGNGNISGGIEELVCQAVECSPELAKRLLTISEQNKIAQTAVPEEKRQGVSTGCLSPERLKRIVEQAA